ncbi:hypothetical protein PGTUg99_030140 [Puccinia graminis f. sp. tritici]|uniref:Uncharacterized protein n=1 Tax=Puccinia graminis f. sp. tritici TaxID=56615 RepID=A0A5B0R7J8_PUCGR|nr:hypothetical protein PGTUg99_030140 [Puccinia graminis f. sp. tritici]
MVRHSRNRVDQKVDESKIIVTNHLHPPQLNSHLFVYGFIAGKWYQLPGDKRDKWFCRICGGGGRGSMAKNLHLHENLPFHIAELRRREDVAQAERAAAEDLARGPPDLQWAPAHNESPPFCPPSDVDSQELQRDLEFIDQDKCFSDREASVGVVSSDSSASSNTGGWDGLMPDDYPAVDVLVTPFEHDQGHTRHQKAKNLDWWPFRAKEYLVSSLLFGHTRTIISRAMYAHVRLMFRICGTALPDWTTVRRGKAKLRKMIGMDVIGR